MRLKIVSLAFCLAASAAPAQPPDATHLPEVTTTATGLAEERPVDETGRPAWTSSRRFSTTRVYIQKAPWEIGFEQWVRFRDFRDGSSKTLFQEEIEIGLPHRMQLDIYENWVSDQDRNADHEDVAFELRFALADWGKIPLNPTLYAEYKIANHGPNVAEFKLLFGEQLAPRLHWGLNFVYERELRATRTTELQVSQGLSYTLIDDVISAGVEMKYIVETEQGGRGEPTHKFLIGPSVQVKPTPRTHLDLVALFGTNEDSPRVEAFLIFGIDFGKIDGHYAPASTRSN